MRKRSVERDVISKRTKLIFVQIQKVLYKVETSFTFKRKLLRSKKNYYQFGVKNQICFDSSFKETC